MIMKKIYFIMALGLATLSGCKSGKTRRAA